MATTGTTLWEAVRKLDESDDGCIHRCYTLEAIQKTLAVYAQAHLGLSPAGAAAFAEQRLEELREPILQILQECP